MSIAFITGLNSFTGQYLATELGDAGYDVLGTTQNPTPSLKDSFCLDINDPIAISDTLKKIQPDKIVHLAAVSFVAHNNIEEMYKSNIIGTRNLLEASSGLKKKPSSIIIPSTANLYGNVSSNPIDEDHTLSPVNDYGVSKLAVESLVKIYSSALPITITRPFNYTGVGQANKFLIPKIVSSFSRKEDVLELGNTNISRDWSDVRDVARIYRLLLDTPTHGAVYNICSGIPHSIEEILDILCEISGHKPQIKVNPDFVRQDDIKMLCGNGRKLNSVIGNFKRHNLHDTLNWMYKNLSS